MSQRADPSVFETLESLDVPDSSNWRGVYVNASGHKPLPFPLGHLTRGLMRKRSDPSAFIGCSTWFFEATYRFLLALVLRPCIRNVVIDDGLAQLFDPILGLDSGRPVSLGGWRELTFECLARVVDHPKALGEIPLFLKQYAGRSSDLDRLRKLNEVVVHFRNRLSHGARDGNAARFEEKEAQLYERAVIRLLLDLDPLRGYALLMHDPDEDEGYIEIDAGGRMVPLPDPRLGDAQVFVSSMGSSRPVPHEVLLGEWQPDRRGIRAAWSMHPFLTLAPSGDSHGALRAQLFERYVSSPPPRVVFDVAQFSEGHAVGETKAEDSSAELVDLMNALIGVLQKKRAAGHRRRETGQSAPTAQAAPTSEVADAEQVARDAELQRIAEERRDDFARRIGHRRDACFQGRSDEIRRVVAALKKRKSLQIQSHIFGMGGVGKTALAVEICYQLIAADVFRDGVLWYRVRQEDVAEVIKRCTIDLDIDPTINAIADLDSRVATFQHHLRKRDLLIVLDNADYEIAVMRPIFDLFGGMPVLVTSRRDFQLPGSVAVRLGELLPEEAQALARALLQPAVDGGRGGFRLHDADIEALCAALGHLPLAVVLASAHIRERRMTITRYLTAWRSRRDRLALLSAERVDAKEEKLRDVRACFALSYDRLDPRTRRVLATVGIWEGRDLSTAHLEHALDEAIWPESRGHEGTLLAAVDVPGTPYGLTGGDDGRVLLWDVSRPERPKQLATVYQSERPITDIVAFPAGAAQEASRRDEATPIPGVSLAAQDDDGLVGVVLGVDVKTQRVPRPELLDCGGRVPLVAGPDGLPTIEITVGRLRGSVSILGRSKDAGLRHRSAIVMAKPAQGGQGQPGTPSWARSLTSIYVPDMSPILTSGQSLRRVALLIRSAAVQPPDAPAAASPLSDEEARFRDLVHAGRRHGYEGLRNHRGVHSGELLNGLQDVVGTLAAASLIEPIPGTGDEDRHRAHPLVSEFAMTHLSGEDQVRVRRKVHEFYLERLKNSRAGLDEEESNIEAAWMWGLRETPRAELSGSHLLVCVRDALHYRGRYALAMAWSQACLDLAREGGDPAPIGLAAARVAFDMNGRGQTADGSNLNAEARSCLANADAIGPVGTHPSNRLWWVWANDDGAGPDASSTSSEAIQTLSDRTRSARGQRVDDYYWARMFPRVWPDKVSIEALDARLPKLTDNLWNHRNCVADLAYGRGTPNHLVSAAAALVSEMDKGGMSEDILMTALRLRFDGHLADFDLDAAAACLEELEALKRATTPDTPHDLFRRAHLMLRRGDPQAARTIWSGTVATRCPSPDRHAPNGWFGDAYFAIAAAATAEARHVLTTVRGCWPSLGCTGRHDFHRLTAWLLASEGKKDQARAAWSHAEAYQRRFCCTAPWNRGFYADLFAAGDALGVTDADVEGALSTIWGRPGDWSRVFVRAPDVRIEESKQPAHGDMVEASL